MPTTILILSPRRQVLILDCWEFCQLMAFLPIHLHDAVDRLLAWSLLVRTPLIMTVNQEAQSAIFFALFILCFCFLTLETSDEPFHAPQTSLMNCLFFRFCGDLSISFAPYPYLFTPVLTLSSGYASALIPRFIKGFRFGFCCKI